MYDDMWLRINCLQSIINLVILDSNNSSFNHLNKVYFCESVIPHLVWLTPDPGFLRKIHLTRPWLSVLPDAAVTDCCGLLYQINMINVILIFWISDLSSDSTCNSTYDGGEMKLMSIDCSVFRIFPWLDDNEGK
jgi:hypothetical protein